MSTRHDAYVKTKDMHNGIKWAGRLVLDRASQDGHNPRLGRVELYFDDDGVGAIWREQKPSPACICPNFGDTGGYRIADLTCPTHGINGTEPGDWWEEN